MATNLPRLTITLQPDVYNTLRKYSDNTGFSISRILNDLAFMALPALDRINTLYGKASEHNQEAYSTLLAAIEGTEARVARAFEDSVAQMDLLASGKASSKPRK